MTKVVLKVIALVFEGIEGFIFDLPACTAALNQANHIIYIDLTVSPSCFYK